MGSAKFRKTLVDYAPEGGPDGLVVGANGNLFVARAESRPGIYVYDPDGKELAYIETSDLPSNVGFDRGRRCQSALHYCRQ